MFLKVKVIYFANKPQYARDIFQIFNSNLLLQYSEISQITLLCDALQRSTLKFNILS